MREEGQAAMPAHIADWCRELTEFTVSLQIRWLAVRTLPPEEVEAELTRISREAGWAYHRYHHVDLDTSRWIAGLGDSAKRQLADLKATTHRTGFRLVTE